MTTFKANQTHILHVCALPESKSWFEGLLKHLDEAGFSQSITSLAKVPGVTEFKEIEAITRYSPKQKSLILRCISALTNIKKSSKSNQSVIILAQGHLESFVSLIASKLLKKKYIVIHHVQPGYFRNLQKRNFIRGHMHEILYKIYIKNSILIQSLSGDVTKSLLKIGVEPKRIIELPHGIDFAAIELKSHGETSIPIDGWPRILMVGRLSPEKNHQVAIRAFSLLINDFPEAKLFIAGEGPCRDQIETLIKKLQLAKRTMMLGHSSNIISLMRNSEILLHIASTESYGRVYIEALVSDLPILTPRIGAVSNLQKIAPEKIILIDDVSPEEIASRLTMYLRSIKSDRKKLPLQFDKYHAHDQVNVFDEISQYLLTSVSDDIF